MGLAALQSLPVQHFLCHDPCQYMATDHAVEDMVAARARLLGSRNPEPYRSGKTVGWIRHQLETAPGEMRDGLLLAVQRLALEPVIIDDPGHKANRIDHCLRFVQHISQEADVLVVHYRRHLPVLGFLASELHTPLINAAYVHELTLRYGVDHLSCWRAVLEIALHLLEDASDTV